MQIESKKYVRHILVIIAFDSYPPNNRQLLYHILHEHIVGKVSQIQTAKKIYVSHGSVDLRNDMDLFKGSFGFACRIKWWLSDGNLFWGGGKTSPCRSKKAEVLLRQFKNFVPQFHEK